MCVIQTWVYELIVGYGIDTHNITFTLMDDITWCLDIWKVLPQHNITGSSSRVHTLTRKTNTDTCWISYRWTMTYLDIELTRGECSGLWFIYTLWYVAFRKKMIAASVGALKSYGPLKYVTTSKIVSFCIFNTKTPMYQGSSYLNIIEVSKWETANIFSSDSFRQYTWNKVVIAMYV